MPVRIRDAQIFFLAEMGYWFIGEVWLDGKTKKWESAFRNQYFIIALYFISCPLLYSISDFEVKLHIAF